MELVWSIIDDRAPYVGHLTLFCLSLDIISRWRDIDETDDHCTGHADYDDAGHTDDDYARHTDDDDTGHTDDDDT